MSSDPKYNAARWFYDQVYQDEPLRRKPVPVPNILPSLLRTARSLETQKALRQSPSSLFLKQGKLLADYTDTYVCDRVPWKYQPTYQTFSNEQLRGYFTWRTAARQGTIDPEPEAYCTLYAYELINNIGTESPLDGFRKLLALLEASHSALFVKDLQRWLQDYIVYYQLDPSMLSPIPSFRLESAIGVFSAPGEFSDSEVAESFDFLAGNYFQRSRFYREHREETNRVIARVAARMNDHYRKAKRTLAEQYFGAFAEHSTCLFLGAVFPLRREETDRTVVLNKARIYRCQRGRWWVKIYANAYCSQGILRETAKAIDAVMRSVWRDPHPIQNRLTTKWLMGIITDEARKEKQRLDDLAAREDAIRQQEAARRQAVAIDFGRLAQIRQDAAVTRDRLMTEEEQMPVEEQVSIAPEVPPEMPPADNSDSDTLLSREEYRLMQCLLYGGELDWVRASGVPLSVLVDGINEKLYDTFCDTVLLLDWSPELVEDYIDELKEMVHP